MAEYERGFSDGFAMAVKHGIKISPPGKPITDGFSAGRDTKRIAVTLPNALFALIRDAAKQNGRSMSGEIVARLNEVR